MITFDYTVTAEDEFRRWLDSVSLPDSKTIRKCGHKFVIRTCPDCRAFLDNVRLPKTLDERMAEKEKRIKRKIEARMRRERAKTRKRLDSQLTTESIECLIQRQLFQ